MSLSVQTMAGRASRRKEISSASARTASGSLSPSPSSLYGGLDDRSKISGAVLSAMVWPNVRRIAVQYERRRRLSEIPNNLIDTAPLVTASSNFQSQTIPYGIVFLKEENRRRVLLILAGTFGIALFRAARPLAKN
jgi:hypothetical protein